MQKYNVEICHFSQPHQILKRLENDKKDQDFQNFVTSQAMYYKILQILYLAMIILICKDVYFKPCEILNFTKYGNIA